MHFRNLRFFHILLVLGLGHILAILRDDYPGILKSLEQNVRGSCSVQSVYLTNASALQSNTIWSKSSDEVLAYISSVDLVEFQAYKSIPSTVTIASPGLGLGMVKCRPTAGTWAASTTNSWQLPASHPRNNKTMCVNVAIMAANGPSKFYEEIKHDVEPFYLIHAKNAIIHETGILGLSCGYIQLHEGCETIFKFLGRKWHQKCKGGLDSKKISWQSIFQTNFSGIWNFGENETIRSCLGPREEFALRASKVFVITAAWDGNYHHFLSDGLSRLIRYKDFLNQNPDILIHIRKSEQYAKKVQYQEASRKCRERLLKVLNIDLSRVVSGTVIADEVYLPKATRCNVPTAHALELRLLVHYMQYQAFPELRFRGGDNAPSNFGPPGLSQYLQFLRPIMPNPFLVNESRHCQDDYLLDIAKIRQRTVIFIHRQCNETRVGTCSKDTWRDWTKSNRRSLELELVSAFPNHKVITLSSDDRCWSECLNCQIRLFASADIIIGNHGAGLTNMIFLRSGTLVVEIVGQFDGRMTPVCGYHGPLAAIFGVHHYIYYYDWKCNSTINAFEIASNSARVFQQLHA